MELILEVFKDMIDQLRPSDMVIMSAGVEDPPEGWAKNFKAILDLGVLEQPRLVGLTFHGLENDEREVFEILEYREWAKKLLDSDTDSLRVLFDETWPGTPPAMKSAFGRAKIVALAGLGEHEWKTDNRMDGYKVELKRIGCELMAHYSMNDYMEAMLASRKDTGLQA